MTLKKIIDSSVPYEEGGVLEAAKFAKGDGWKDKGRSVGLENVPHFDEDTRLQLIDDLKNKRPIEQIIKEYRFFAELISNSKAEGKAK